MKQCGINYSDMLKDRQLWYGFMYSRITYIDIAKGIGILLVIAGHLFRYDSYISTVIFSFHMPLFFFLSGMVEHYQDVKFSQYLKKAFNSCLVSWILFALLGLFITLLVPAWRLNLNFGENYQIYLWYGYKFYSYRSDMVFD